MLMSAKLPLPRQVFGHGFMTMNGQRMSKSLGTIIDPIEAADRFGADPLRLYLVKEIAFGGDGDFSWERYTERYNVDLANNLGNLVSRVAAMAAKYRGGRLRATGAGTDQLARVGEAIAVEYRTAMDRFLLHEGAAAAFRLIDAANEFIAATSPWAMAKDPAKADQLTQVLFDTAEAIRLAAVLLLPIMPTAATEILRRVGARSDDLRLDRDGIWRTDGERVLAQDGPLWPRHEKHADVDVPARGSEARAASASTRLSPNLERTSMTDNPTALGSAAPSTAAPSTTAPSTTAPGTTAPGTTAPSTLAPGTPAPSAVAPGAVAPSDRISIDDFMKVELRVAKVLAAERVEKSKKLLKLHVDVGTEHRTLVAGIAEAYEPESLVGKTVVIVFNLKPAKLMGIESNGMVLAASPDGGKPEIVTFANPPEPGTRVR
jgi:methionyl-tRNA synthetase